MIGWLNSVAFSAFGAPTTWAEVIGFVTGAICVYWVAQQNILNWPIGIANNFVFLLLFATAGLYADSGLQLVYIALAGWGWWAWLHGGADRAELPVSRTTRLEWAWIAAFGVVGTAALVVILARYMGSTVPLWDAITTSLSLVATWGQCRKKLESWWLWIAADVIYIPLYHYKHLTLTAILYVGFLALCILGLVRWTGDLRDEQRREFEAGRATEVVVV